MRVTVLHSQERLNNCLRSDSAKEVYNLGEEVNILMRHREIVQDSARDYLIYLLKRFPKGRLDSKFMESKFVEDYLAFDPTKGTLRHQHNSIEMNLA